MWRIEAAMYFWNLGMGSFSRQKSNGPATPVTTAEVEQNLVHDKVRNPEVVDLMSIASSRNGV